MFNLFFTFDPFILCVAGGVPWMDIRGKLVTGCSLHYVASGDGAQVIRLDSKHLHD